MRVKINEKPDLPKTEMICDNGLHPKLNKYELTKYLNEHSTTVFIGAPKSGKTSLIVSLFKKPLAKVWHNIFLFQPVESGQSIKNNIFDKLPEEKRYFELNSENLNNVMDYLKEEDKEYNSVIIFDDMTAYLKDKETLKTFKELVFNRRHLRCSIFFLVQTWHSIPKEIRRLFNNIFLFKASLDETTTLFKEVVDQHSDKIHNIIKLVYNEPYKFLFINTTNNKLFDGWNEILFDE